jgi:hypothetical protein
MWPTPSSAPRLWRPLELSSLERPDTLPVELEPLEAELPELELLPLELPLELLPELLPELPPLDPDPPRAIAGVAIRLIARTVAIAADMFFRLNMMGHP